MKLLQINSTYNWGSTGRIADEIGQTVISHGWDSYLAYGRGFNFGVSIPIKVGVKLDVYFHVLMTRLFDRHGLASKWATRKLIKQIKRIKPDIIHLHNIHGYYLNYQQLFGFLASVNIPIVWTLHDCWAFTGHCGYFSYFNCERFIDGCYDCPLQKDYPTSLGFDRSAKNYKDKMKAFTSIPSLTLIPVSNWLAGELKLSFLKNQSVRVIHNGINIETFKTKNEAKDTLGFKDGFIVLGVANVWSKRKGFDDFIRLRELLPADFCIVLIGLSKTQATNLPKGIYGINRTDNVEELVMYYSAADVFFNPTWEDNFPTTNLEALACGTPVITYNTGGSIEVVDSLTGFVIEQGDLSEAARIMNMIKQKGKDAYSISCREKAVSHYNKFVCYEEYYKLYKELLTTSTCK